jgi:tetratricopeptide (TPR) repeat protein
LDRKRFFAEEDFIENYDAEINKAIEVYWALDLYSKGYQFDCELTGYGAMVDPKQIEFINLENETAEDLYKKGIGLIGKSNFGAAIICFSIALEIEPTNPKPWYAKGYCKEQI